MRCLRSGERKAGFLGHFDGAAGAFRAQVESKILLAEIKCAIDQFIQAPVLRASSGCRAAYILRSKPVFSAS
jgi:hypothetical protein